MASVESVACEVPAQLDLPFSPFSIEEIRRVVIEKGVVEARRDHAAEWLHEDGLRPWTHRPSIFHEIPNSCADDRSCWISASHLER
jgi:hypothetical protein